jgi:hypothetical protein
VPRGQRDGSLITLILIDSFPDDSIKKESNAYLDKIKIITDINRNNVSNIQIQKDATETYANLLYTNYILPLQSIQPSSVTRSS